MNAVARQSAPQSEPRRRLLLASDRRDQSADLARILAGIAEIETISTAQLPDVPSQNLSGIVVDINLRSAESVQMVRRKLLGGGYQPIPRLFVLADELHHGSMQAWALGATDTIARPFDPRDLLARIRAAFPDPSETTEAARAEAMSKGVAAAHSVLVKIFDRLPAGQPLTYHDVIRAEAPILKAIKRSSLREWLAVVGRHHNESYRLALFATGYAVAFAQHLGMREEDQRRLTRAALLYDVGKAFVDVGVLDDLDGLQGERLHKFREHPRRGYEALAAEGSFPRETLDVILHHHELLDGSGYPDALHGDQISDIVRITTIVDIFTSLVAPRKNHVPLMPLHAFSRMESMGDKIDQRLLQAFRPVPLGG
ncbi:HD domain-containing phosphohydrolase [Rhodopseudomonas pseudopalustris]|uniref:Response regulator receiver modulated metal dependent phosphohydrolase n=2 Tax=Rhodopseudomonas TaxID=1073 RepID=Q12ZV7_RHOPS|nr:HD domain-containing phosphohydrolase [Rhodopseudomonas pseudopalustris]ABE41632.1 response regulator receiver modulated metal dependent phosphohydrolase [Rhodopseudomonas palustris BisB5]MBB1090424.1 HD domain-containing protein [Rhodopseudomonas palustris]SEO12806.1 response regulator receiver modulated metal dependent phosphohydrolase [Rhodopseudomonas pseudopalustris]